MRPKFAPAAQLAEQDTRLTHPLREIPFDGWLKLHPYYRSSRAAIVLSCQRGKAGARQDVMLSPSFPNYARRRHRIRRRTRGEEIDLSRNARRKECPLAPDQQRGILPD